jgi:hypothetical protein
MKHRTGALPLGFQATFRFDRAARGVIVDWTGSTPRRWTRDEFDEFLAAYGEARRRFRADAEEVEEEGHNTLAAWAERVGERVLLVRIEGGQLKLTRIGADGTPPTLH